MPILIDQVLYHAEFWYLITASYTRRVDLILLDQQIRCAEDWLVPVWEAMRKELLQREVLHADETTVQVLK